MSDAQTNSPTGWTDELEEYLVAHGHKPASKPALESYELLSDTPRRTLIKQSTYEQTWRVAFPDSYHLEQSIIQKRITCTQGTGEVYERLFELQKRGIYSNYFPRIIHFEREEDAYVWVSMEDIAGETLEDVRSQSAHIDELVFELFPEILNAVQTLHTIDGAPLIHRDLNPKNILVASDSVKLIDFGISRVYDQAKDYDTTYFGTREYAAPEQFGFSQTDVRTDIYALACILFFLVVGRSPDRTDRLYEFAFPGEYAWVSPLIKQGMELDPAKRFSSVAAFREAFLRAAGLNEDVPESQQISHLASDQALTTEISRPAPQSSTSTHEISHGLLRRVIRFWRGTPEERERIAHKQSSAFRELGLVYNGALVMIWAFLLIGLCLSPTGISSNGVPLSRWESIAVFIAVIGLSLPHFLYIISDRRIIRRNFPRLGNIHLIAETFIAGILGFLWFMVGIILTIVFGS